jgi:thiol-disulfide isomerase/thioredoxin
MFRRFAVMAAAAVCVAASAVQAQTLKVGSKAPPLSIEQWVLGDPVKEFKPGHTYVVEFWATWCPPCLKSIPHLTKLQEEYGDAITVIGVAGSERGKTSKQLGVLRKFIKKQGDKMVYTVGYESDRETVNAWMKAAGRNGIPSAFVVDGTGTITWIGHPMDGLDGAIEKAVAKKGKGGEADASRPYELMVGDKAPAIYADSWVKGEPVTEFERNHVYVMEFWATWCGPCIRGIPHLTEIQKKFKDKGVTVIGMNIWEDKPQKKVPAFVKEKGDEMNYTVAIQDGTKMADKWMEAAGQNGIPTAMIVNGEGRIAWIGHPMSMDEPLEKIVAGEWDLDEQAKKYAQEIAAQAKAEKVGNELRAAMGDEDFDKVIDLLEGLVKSDEETAMMYVANVFPYLLRAEKFDGAYGLAWKLFKGAGSEDSSFLNAIAWSIVDPDAVPAKQDLKLALAAAKQANKLTDNKDPAILDTLAKVYWDMGQKKKAIDIQKQAVEHSEGTPFEEDLKDRLEQFIKDAG